MTYAAPLRTTPVTEITTDQVLRVLKPLWLTKSETATRLRSRIERVLDWAKAHGHREGENPAAWKGNLKDLLPALPPKRKRIKHYPAMPYADVPDFMGRLRVMAGMGARALELTILTAARTGETLGAQWSEIDFEERLWIVPAHRMKAAVEHVVPLSDRAVRILKDLNKLRISEFVFPGTRHGRPLSSAVMKRVLKRMRISSDKASVHGFRSSFRDWAGDCTTFPREVAEAALAHLVGDDVERAYRRGDALGKRRQLMMAWASHCEPKAGNIVHIRRRSH
jgi:integrase